MNARFHFLLLMILLAACGKKPDRSKYVEYHKPIQGILPYFKGEDMNPYWQSSGRLPGDLKRIGPFTYTRENGKIITENDVKGKYVLVGFFFSRCAGICPMVTANLKRISEKIPDQKDLVLMSISIDPAHDQIAELKEFKSRFDGSKANWMFLTGKKDEIYDMARKTFNADVIVRQKKDVDDFVHTENIYLLDKDSYLRGIYRAKGLGDIDRLVNDLKMLRATKIS